ncbi:MAG: hypothetical protein ACREMQ_21870 [Longimicrobiales bacterium]
MKDRDMAEASREAGLGRRALLGRAASAAATLVVSQSLLSCAEGAMGLEDDDDDDGSTAACVLTAALTEGPYFVDERLDHSDIRNDPVTGAVSAGVPLDLTFDVSRVANNACTPLTGAYLDVWHADAAGVYSDVAGAGAGRRFLSGYQITDAAGATHCRRRNGRRSRCRRPRAGAVTAATSTSGFVSRDRVSWLAASSQARRASRC